MEERSARSQGQGAAGGRPARVVTATEAAERFGAIIDRVREDRAVHLVERGGAPVAQIGPAPSRAFTVQDFVDLVESTPRASEEHLRAVEEGIAVSQQQQVPADPWAC